MTDENGSQNNLFSEESEADMRIIFHGTGLGNASSIEDVGFRKSENSGEVRAAVSRVVEIYEMMDWRGADGGGFAVLKPFSLLHDLQDPEQGSPLFFANTSNSASLYASMDFAGGEKQRALRRSIRDLRRFADDPHEYEQRRQAFQCHPITGPPPPVDLDWLTEQLGMLKDIEAAADEPLKTYTGGIVYAVTVHEDDLPHYKYGGGMGIFTHWGVPASRIVAKASISAEFEWEPKSLDEAALRRIELGVETLM